MSRPPSVQELRAASMRVVELFALYNLRSCLFGSVACNLFGVSRTPNDVDLIVLTDQYDQEELKQILVDEDDDFFLVDSRNPNADYRVLWYRLRPSRRGNPRSCKVDILVPGVLDIPDVPRRRLRWIDGLPVMPLVPLILLKLQGWRDHRDSYREDQQEKQHVDVQDLDQLLQIAIDRGQTVWQDNLSWLPSELIHNAQSMVYEFIANISGFDEDWETLGFEV
ncbi:hypothetical protein C2E23DRAFT_851723 [Lenzites betulinus]|nr:hypothetical protein C2E23DRAFT_851723 [Lenzites betulinus]